MRKLIGLLVCLALGASALGGASIAGAEEPAPEAAATGAQTIEPLDEACEANKVCLYDSPGFNNWSLKIDCSHGGDVESTAEGAKNKCGNKTVWLRVNGNSIRCLDPGEQAGSPGLFNSVWISEEYGSFC